MSHRLVKGKKVYMTKADRLVFDAEKEKEKEQRRIEKEQKKEQTAKAGSFGRFTKEQSHFKDDEFEHQKTK